jgi:hypothetical protein
MNVPDKCAEPERAGRAPGGGGARRRRRAGGGGPAARRRRRPGPPPAPRRGTAAAGTRCARCSKMSGAPPPPAATQYGAPPAAYGYGAPPPMAQVVPNVFHAGASPFPMTFIKQNRSLDTITCASASSPLALAPSCKRAQLAFPARTGANSSAPATPFTPPPTPFHFCRPCDAARAHLHFHRHRAAGAVPAELRHWLRHMVERGLHVWLYLHWPPAPYRRRGNSRRVGGPPPS